MLAMSGRTVWLNWLTFFEEKGQKKYDFFLQNFYIFYKI